jgi:hypothetical protein
MFEPLQLYFRLNSQDATARGIKETCIVPSLPSFPWGNTTTNVLSTHTHTHTNILIFCLNHSTIQLKGVNRKNTMTQTLQSTFLQDQVLTSLPLASNQIFSFAFHKSKIFNLDRNVSQNALQPVGFKPKGIIFDLHLKTTSLFECSIR